MTFLFVIACVFATICVFFFGYHKGREDAVAEPRWHTEVTEAFALNVVYCTIGATIHARHGNWKFLDELADILAGVHSHRLCYLEALDKLQELYKRMKGEKS